LFRGRRTCDGLSVRRLLLALVSALVLLLGGGSASAGSSVPTILGFTDDAPKYGDFGLLDDMVDLGVKENRWSVRWDETQPTTIVDQGFIDKALPEAEKRGIRIVFSFEAIRPAAIGANETRQDQFCAFVKQVAQRYYPRVSDYIVGNESNRQRFWQPQYDAAGNYVAATDYEHTLAKCYDALKSVSPNITVIGLALGADGNNNPNAPSNLSRSPVLYIKQFAEAYKASGRDRPVLDVLAHHPYPDVQDTDPPEKGYQWPNVGVPNLDRIKQAIWDGFNGTAQPIFPDEPGGLLTDAAGKPLPHASPISTFAHGEHAVTTPLTLKFKIDEIGWQTAIIDSKKSLYSGTENVQTIDEPTQASFYHRMWRYYLCDDLINEALIFHIIDEQDLGRFQSGVEWVDHTHKASYAALKKLIQDTLAKCNDTPVKWRHTTNVLNASASFKPSAAFVFNATATEDFQYVAGIYRAGKTPDKDVPVQTAVGTSKAYYKYSFKQAGKLKPGTYVYKITMKAAMNLSRITVLRSKPFTRR
jgi:hypothetical protein